MTVIFSIRISPELRARFKTLVKDSNLSIREATEQALQDFINKHTEKPNLTPVKSKPMQLPPGPPGIPERYFLRE